MQMSDIPNSNMFSCMNPVDHTVGPVIWKGISLNPSDTIARLTQ